MASRGLRRIRASCTACVTGPGRTCEPQKAGYTTSFSSGVPQRRSASRTASDTATTRE